MLMPRLTVLAEPNGIVAPDVKELSFCFKPPPSWTEA